MSPKTLFQKSNSNFFRQLQLPQIQFILREFEKQAAIMDMKGEIVDSSIDQATDVDQDEDERSVF